VILALLVFCLSAQFSASADQLALRLRFNTHRDRADLVACPAFAALIGRHKLFNVGAKYSDPRDATFLNADSSARLTIVGHAEASIVSVRSNEPLTREDLSALRACAA
jgi:hypothetical protein